MQDVEDVLGVAAVRARVKRQCQRGPSRRWRDTRANGRWLNGDRQRRWTNRCRWGQQARRTNGSRWGELARRTNCSQWAGRAGGGRRRSQQRRRRGFGQARLRAARQLHTARREHGDANYDQQPDPPPRHTAARTSTTLPRSRRSRRAAWRAAGRGSRRAMCHAGRV